MGLLSPVVKQAQATMRKIREACSNGVDLDPSKTHHMTDPYDVTNETAPLFGFPSSRAELEISVGKVLLS